MDFELLGEIDNVQVIAEGRGAGHGYIRVVDESGDSYLYPRQRFIDVMLPRRLPRTARKTFA